MDFEQELELCEEDTSLLKSLHECQWTEALKLIEEEKGVNTVVSGVLSHVEMQSELTGEEDANFTVDRTPYSHV